MSSSQVPLLHKQNQHPPISATGSVNPQQHPHQHHQQRRTSMANLRRHRSTKRYASRRLSRRRPSSRRTSRLPSDDLDELALMQQASSGQDGMFDCIHLFPMRPHGLFVAAMGVILSIVGLVATSTLLLRNAVLVELASLPPGCTDFVQNITANASGSNLAFPGNASNSYANGLRNRDGPSERTSLRHKPYPAPRLSVQTSIQDTLVKVARSEPPQDINCSAYTTFIYLLGHGLQGSSRFDSNLGPVSTYFFVNSQMLWCGFVVSIVFLWSSISLWSGIWHFRRRTLVPWLLVSGITILFLIMSTVWFLICNRGWFKLLSLVPAGLGLLFLYWWLLINDLLEEIHEDKKAEAAVIADGLVLTTSAAAALIPDAAVSSVHQYDPQEAIQTNGHVNEGIVQLSEGTSQHLLPGANGLTGSRDRTSLPTVDEMSPANRRELTLV